MSDGEQDAVEEMHGGNGALPGKKALILDDDMRNIFALATILDEQGMVIVSADNGRDTIKMVETDPTIDIALMDIMMPEMDGMETMRHIRKLPRGRDLPMVAVTAKAMKGDRDKCIEAGAWDYMSKPVDPMHMMSVLREVKQLTSTADDAIEADRPAVNCRVLVVDDNLDAAETVAVFLELAGHQVKAVTDGLQALACAPVYAPEVVVLDIGLPTMDGYEVARRLRATEQTRAVLLIALTGYGQEADGERALQAGFDRHLIKRADSGELARLIADWRAIPPTENLAVRVGVR